MSLFFVKVLFDLCLDRGIVGDDGGNVLLIHLTVDVVLGDLDNQRDHKQNTDQVGDHHKTVEGIGDVPSKGRGKHRTEDNGDYVDNAEDKGSLCTEEVLPGLGAVVGPAKHGGEGEEEHSDGYELATEINSEVKYLVECTAHKGRVGESLRDLTGLGIEYATVESTGGENYESGHGTNDHSVCKYLKYTPHTLLNGLLNAGVGVNHNGRTETCLVGEHAALEAVGHSYDDTADAAAHECLGREGVSEDSLEGGDDSLIVDSDDHKASCNEENDHKGNDLLGNVCDTLNTAEGDNCGQRHNDNAENDIVKGNAAENADGGESLYVKGRGNVCYDLVDLTHASDTEGSQHSEDTEENGKNTAGLLEGRFAVAVLVGVASHTVLQVVHRTAGPFAFAVLTSEIDTQNVFRVVGHHTEECGNPHPEHGTGTTDTDSGGNTGDITGTDRCGKRGTKRLEGRDNALFLAVLHNVLGEHTAYGVLPPQTEARDLKYACTEGYDNAGSNQKNQTKNSPNDSVDAVVYRSDFFEKCFHFSLLKIKNLTGAKHVPSKKQ